MDVYSRSQRSKIMARIKGKNTKPERIVRRIAHPVGDEADAISPLQQLAREVAARSNCLIANPDLRLTA
jgi:G:T-mismatch repair DNA endonuclease (very short patch repair protein)